MRRSAGFFFCFLSLIYSAASAVVPTQPAGEVLETYDLEPQETVAVVRSTPVPDCAANSVFLLARISGLNTTYQHCVQLLPIKPEGNSAIEVRDALKSIGFNVRSMKIKTSEIGTLKNAAILWSPPAQLPEFQKEHQIGHFSVVRPISKDVFQLVDFPIEPLKFTTRDWVKYLVDSKVDEIDLLECVRAAATKPDLNSHDGDQQSTLPGRMKSVDSTVVVSGNTHASVVGLVTKGDIAEGESVNIRFRLENHTTQKLPIEKIDWQCTCTSITSDKIVIEPGGFCDLDMVVSLVQKYGNFQATGLVRFSNECGLPPVFLMLRANACARWSASPAVVDLGHVDPTSAPIHVQAILTPTKYAGNSKISRAMSKSDPLSCAIASTQGTNKTVLDIVFNPKGTAGIYVGQIYYFCDSEKDAANMIEVRGQVEALVSVVPSQVLFSPTGEGLASVQLAFTPANGRHIKMLAAKSSNPSVSIIDVSTDQYADNVKSKVSIAKPITTATSGQLEYEFAVQETNENYKVVVPFVVPE